VADSGLPARPITATADTAKPSRWRFLEHPTRTALAGVASLLAARLCRVPEPYWAPITTLVITQSSLGAAWEVSKQRFAGTVLGAILGTVAATLCGSHDQIGVRTLAFGLGVFVLGLLWEAVYTDRAAYRFGGITLAIVLMVPHTGPAWVIAFSRFAGVCIGIATALLFATLWPEK